MSTTGKLAEALAAVQAELPSIAKTKTARSRSYSYSYADLAAVSSTVMPLLARHGLAFSVCPQVRDTGPVLVGLLLHSSGESLTGELPMIGVQDAQSLGSAITYGRRYLLGAMTGAVTDDDEDGQIATQAAHRPHVDEGARAALLKRLAAAVQDMPAMAAWWERTHGHRIGETTDLRALAELVESAEARTKGDGDVAA